MSPNPILSFVSFEGFYLDFVACIGFLQWETLLQR